MLREKIVQQLNEALAAKNALTALATEITLIAEALIKVVKGGGCIYACGNGGSACDAAHFAEELVARYKRERPGIKAQHFGDPGTLTCWANDYSFDEVFARQADTFLTKNDALLVFTTSGNSPNILRALAVAKQKGALSVALLGKDGGKAKALSNLSLIVPSDSTARIQECHGTIVHILCEAIELSIMSEQAIG